MIDIDDGSTLGPTFRRAADVYGSRDLLTMAPDAQRHYHRDGYSITYAQARDEVARLTELYASRGYGSGHRVALFLENRPEHLLHKLALNALGACCVPINPDLRANEIAYLLAHARVDLAVVVACREAQLLQGIAQSSHRPGVVLFELFDEGPPPPATRATNAVPAADTPASILYTSGTTGRPKGCVLSHGYELAAGEAYATRGGLAAIGLAQERLYNPLPLFHVNASVLSFACVLLTGSCQVQGERFHPQRFWREVRDTRATVVHYLGVMAPMLMQQPQSSADRDHVVRFGFGAGIEPGLHEPFERRFGFPLVEIWGMTEMVRVLADCEAPRKRGTRAFGRAVAGVEVRVVDDDERDVAAGRAGEMLVRHSADRPRHHFFSGYLDDPQATEHAWRGGWFHTGDVVTRDDDGTLHFVDRRKNIVRRSGENIAAAEVEALIQSHELVSHAAVFAVKDEVREEEVYACVVPRDLGVLASGQRLAVVDALFEHCMDGLAYYKAPGYIWLTDALPTSGTQKIQKHAVFDRDVDPRTAPGVIDLRHRKRRDKSVAPGLLR